MSYDLVLVRVRGDADPEALALAVLEDEGDDPNPGPIDPAAETRKRELVEELRKVDPSLAAFPFDPAEIARAEGVSEGEARRRWRHVELNGPEDGNGVQVSLHDEHATLTVPYWHQGDAARATWETIWKYLGTLERAGLRAYDPQLERVLVLARDLDTVTARYAEGVVVTRQVALTGKAQVKPWWKFW